MWQDLLRLHLPFNIPLVGREIVIHGFGLMMVIGFLGGMELGRFLARRSRINPDLFANAAIIGLITGVIGARLSHVLENLADYTRADRTFAQNFADAVNISSGGLTYYGGFLLAFPILVGYALWKKMPLRTGMDIVAPCLMVGLGFGRVGCFLNGCCFGATCDAPWAVTFPYGSPAYEEHVEQHRIAAPPELRIPTLTGERLVTRDEVAEGKFDQPNVVDPNRPVQIALTPAMQTAIATHRSLPIHPTQLYSAITALGLAVLLTVHFTTSHAPGQTFALMMMLEGAARYTLEMLRVEPSVIGNLSISMILSIALIIAGTLLWFAFRRRHGDGLFQRPMFDRAAAQG